MHNDLQELEQQVEKLIQLSERLNQENRHLRKQQVVLKRALCQFLKAAISSSTLQANQFHPSKAQRPHLQVRPLMRQSFSSKFLRYIETLKS